MPSAGEVEQQRRAQNRIVAAARDALTRFWNRLDMTDLIAVREALEEFWPTLIDTYGAASAEAAALWAEELLGQAQIAGTTNVAQVNATARWALGPAFKGEPAVTLANLGIALDRFVKDHGRDTIAASSERAGVSWARVPSGAETCNWCLILASRGAVYKSARTAGDGRKYHGDCDCVPTPIRGGDDLPSGYDPDGLYQRYLDAAAKAGSGRIEDIAAAAREQFGGN